MKFECGKYIDMWSAKKQSRLSRWHKQFAWLPVKIEKYDCRWLEVVWRRGEYVYVNGYCWWKWEYRSKDDLSLEREIKNENK